MCLFVLGEHWDVKWLGTVVGMLNSLETANCFSKWLYLFTFPPAVCEIGSSVRCSNQIWHAKFINLSVFMDTSYCSYMVLTYIFLMTISNVLPGDYLPSVHLLCWSIFSNLLCFVFNVSLLLSYWVMTTLYTFQNKSPLSNMHIITISSIFVYILSLLIALKNQSFEFW